MCRNRLRRPTLYLKGKVLACIFARDKMPRRLYTSQCFCLRSLDGVQQREISSEKIECFQHGASGMCMTFIAFVTGGRIPENVPVHVS